MRKALVMFLVIGLLAFVACSPDSSLNEELVNVTITSRDTRALEASTNFNIGDVTTWKYTAEKADNGLKTGETTEQVELKDGKTQQLSQGSWNFKLFGYKGKDLICVGEAPNTTITVEMHTITIQVGALTTAGGMGKIAIADDIKIVDKDGNSVADGSTEYKKTVIVRNSNGDALTDLDEVPSGVYSVEVVYTGTAKDGAAYTAASEKKYFNVFDNLTTTVSGNIKELTQAGEAKPEEGKVVASVDGKLYTSIADALKDATVEKPLILTSDATLEESVVLSKDADINLNGNKLVLDEQLAIKGSSETSKATVTIKNGVLNSDASGSDVYGIAVEANGALIMDNVEYFASPRAIKIKEYADNASLKVVNSTIISNGGAMAIQTDASTRLLDESSNKYVASQGVEIKIINSYIEAENCTESGSVSEDTTALLFNIDGTLTIENSTFIGARQGAIIRGGNATIKNSTFVSNGTTINYYDDNKKEAEKNYDYVDKNWGNGNEVPLAALVIGNRSNAYKYPTTVTLDNVTLSTPKEETERKLMYVYQNEGAPEVTVRGTLNDLYDVEAKENKRIFFNDATSIKSLGLFNLAANRTNTKGKTVTIELGNEEFKDIAYSENRTGYTGKGLLIGNRSLNSHGSELVTNEKDKLTLIIEGGSVTSSSTGYKSIDGLSGTSVYMLLPNGNTDVTFKNVIFNNVISFDIQKYSSPWSNLDSLTLDSCTFNGIIVGTVPSEKVKIDGCTFNEYINTTYANNSNPIWWRADLEGRDGNFVTIEQFEFTNNRVSSTRPIKIERVGRRDNSKKYTPVFKFLDNTFDISSQSSDTVTKNMAINIGQQDNKSYYHLYDDGNTISSNTASLYTAALGSGSNQWLAVPGTKIMDRKGNEKTIIARVWKTTTGETFEMKSIEK